MCDALLQNVHKIDGPRLLEALRRLPGMDTIPAVFMTAKVRGGEIDAYKTMGVAGVISKPFDTLTLCDTLRELWKKYNADNAGEHLLQATSNG